MASGTTVESSHCSYTRELHIDSWKEEWDRHVFWFRYALHEKLDGAGQETDKEKEKSYTHLTPKHACSCFNKHYGNRNLCLSMRQAIA